VSSPVNDLLNFIEIVNECSHFPCSVIVISVGTEVNVSDLQHLNLCDFENYFLTYNKQLQNKPFRKNIQYVNFNALYDDNPNLSSDAVLKPILKEFFKEITSQFLEYINKNNINPIDLADLKSKSLHNYIEFRKKKQLEKYTTPNYLITEMSILLDDIKSMGYSQEEFLKSFPTLPTFERHYIVNVLNKQKAHANKENNSVRGAGKNSNNLSKLLFLKIIYHR
jgi:hypothetical protein